MAWTAPRDWTGISDDIVTAAMLNTDVRDNLLFLGGTSDVTTGHTHTGAAGMGAKSMSGLTLTNLGVLTFADQEENPDAAGELQMNGNDLLWYGASLVNLTAADASSGASLRSLGTTSVKAAAGNHTHGIDEIDTPLKYVSGRGSTNGYVWQDVTESVGTTESLLGAAQSPTFSGANVGRVVSGFWVGGHNDGDEAFEYTLRLYIDGSLVASTTTTLALTPNTAHHYAYAISVEYTEDEATSEDALELKIIRAVVGGGSGTGGTHATLGYGLTNTFANAQ